ncbi:MAG: methionyl-tRNA formyltransferase [Burkholderiaceae bacterium]|nr:methionyl-tRNA formyltransferase [Burkholderiaceae bacterium]
MRLVFAGTPEFARVALAALSQAGHEILAVFTQPDRPKGRGLDVVQSPVKQEALRLGVNVLQPQSLRQGRPGAEEAKAALRTLGPDLMVVAAYGLILPADVLATPRYGCLNIHASLLPRWRGAAPIQRAIAAGDLQTGVALMQMEEGLDTGPVWSMSTTEIQPEDNFQTLHDRLAEIGARELVALLANFPASGKSPQPQAAEGVVYAHKIEKEDLRIDWSKSSREVADQIRAFDPVPGALASIGSLQIKCFDPKVVSTDLKNPVCGQIIQADRDGFLVACGSGTVSIGAAQKPGGKRLGFREFLNGRPVTAGQCFDLVKE